MALTFFKTPKNKQYNYKPVYYDARKEALEKLENTAYSEAKEEKKEYEKALRERINMRWKRTQQKKAKSGARNRLLIILGALFLLTYLLFYL